MILKRKSKSNSSWEKGQNCIVAPKLPMPLKEENYNRQEESQTYYS